MTSHDVVGLVRRRLRTKRVGHAGTLDPAAEGVLVVAVGRATKLIDRVQSQEKQYLAHLVLGASTDTLDAEGRLINQQHGPFPSPAEITTVLRQFTGMIEQVPPAHSALKFGGEALYHRARRGEEIDIPSRSVMIHDARLLASDGADIIVLIDCSKGTYIRSLARDIGAALALPSYLHYLLRTRSGRFDLAQAWSIEEIAQQLSPETFATMALHPDSALTDAARVILDGSSVPAWYHGQPVRAGNETPDDRELGAQASVYRFDGEWLGVAQRIADEAWQPRTVMPSERPNS